MNISVYEFLALTVALNLFWLVPCFYNYLNTKSHYYHELFIHELETNKKLYPERYIPLKDKIRKFFKRSN